MQKRFAILVSLSLLAANAHADRYSEAARYNEVSAQAIGCMQNLTVVKIRGGETNARRVVPEVSKLCGGILRAYLVNEAHWSKKDAGDQSMTLARRMWEIIAY